MRMTIIPLSEKEMVRIGGANLVEFIISGLRELEKSLELNKLDPQRLSGDQKVKINNLVKLLHRLASLYPFDPLTGKLIFEAKVLIDVLKKFQRETFDSSAISLGKESKESKKIDLMIDLINRHLESWRRKMLREILLPPGNSHTSICYHPEFYATYKHKPAYLPEDYRSNFFFEAMIKEFCPFTTLIGFHPYSEFQSEVQEGRSLEELTTVDINVDVLKNHAIEIADNLRAFRVHGPGENKKYPGSYIIVKGGHHRLRALFLKYLKKGGWVKVRTTSDF